MEPTAEIEHERQRAQETEGSHPLCNCMCVTRPRRPPASRLACSLCSRETPDHLIGPRPGSQCARLPCVVLPHLPARPHGLLPSPLAGALAIPAGFGLPNVLCPPTLAWTVPLSLLISKPPSSLSAQPLPLPLQACTPWPSSHTLSSSVRRIRPLASPGPLVLTPCEPVHSRQCHCLYFLSL